VARSGVPRERQSQERHDWPIVQLSLSKHGYKQATPLLCKKFLARKNTGTDMCCSGHILCTQGGACIRRLHCNLTLGEHQQAWAVKVELNNLVTVHVPICWIYTCPEVPVA